MGAPRHGGKQTAFGDNREWHMPNCIGQRAE
jgi:hypothetical protein